MWSYTKSAVMNLFMANLRENETENLQTAPK